MSWADLLGKFKKYSLDEIRNMQSEFYPEAYALNQSQLDTPFRWLRTLRSEGDQELYSLGNQKAHLLTVFKWSTLWMSLRSILSEVRSSSVLANWDQQANLLNGKQTTTLWIKLRQCTSLMRCSTIHTENDHDSYSIHEIKTLALWMKSRSSRTWVRPSYLHPAWDPPAYALVEIECPTILMSSQSIRTSFDQEMYVLDESQKQTSLMRWGTCMLTVTNMYHLSLSHLLPVHLVTWDPYTNSEKSNISVLSALFVWAAARTMRISNTTNRLKNCILRMLNYPVLVG